MCFNHQKEYTADIPIAEQARPYYEGKKRIRYLDFQNTKDKDIALYCLRNYPYMAGDFDVSNDKQLAVLKTWINESLKNYITCVDLDIYNIVENSKLLATYLTNKLADTLDETEGLSLINSYDNKLVLNYHYETKRGETISYFDTALGVPTSLVATANIRLKLIDARKLVEKVDVDIHKIDAPIIESFITSAFNCIVRDMVLSVITKENLSFYDLSQHYTELNQAMLEKLGEYFTSCGLQTTYFAFSDISVPNNTEQLLKNQFFAIAEAERIKAHEQKIEKASLDLYERKAEIHSKYPDFPITLTEAEKDFALNRYLARTGHDTTLKANIKEKALSGRKEELSGTETVGDESVPPTVVSYTFRFIYAVVVVVLYIVALIMFAGGLRLGFAALACVTFGAGLTFACCYKKIKYGTETRQIVETDDEDDDFHETETVGSFDDEQQD